MMSTCGSQENDSKKSHQLIRDVTMVFSGEFFANCTLHQPRQRRQDIDGRVNLSIVELSVYENLAFSNVSRQIRNGMRNVLKYHSIVR